MSYSLKHKLKGNDLSIGSWITLAHSSIAELFVNAGFEWLAVDLEHSVISIREAEELIRVIELSGASPLVRLTSNNSDQIKRVMDAGAHGVIVPMVKTKEDVENAIKAVRYPSSGNRSIGLARAQRWGNSFSKYFEWLENESIVIVQIEHIDAVNNLEDIFSVEGIDAFIIGPYDLSGSMNKPGKFDDKEFLQAIEKIKITAKAYNICGGIHIVEPSPEDLKSRIDEGYKFIAYSLDTRMLDVSARKGLSILNR
jgi:2-keto-3-deoxy-L-rhamnonate aldolase RhmA